MMVGDHSHILLVAKNSFSDGVLPYCHGELAGSCASIILGIFGRLAFLVLQNLPLLTSVNHFAWRNKFLMNSVIKFQKRSTYSLYTNVWMQLGQAVVTGGLLYGFWFLIVTQLHSSAFLMHFPSLKQNLTQACCSFHIIFWKTADCT